MTVSVPARAGRRTSPAYLSVLALVAAAVLARLVGAAHPRVVGAEIGFVSLFVESLPFLLAGAVLSASLHSRAGSRVLAAAVRRPRLAGALAPVVGTALPLCDCGLLPLARRFRDAGSTRPVNAFLAGAPLTNPIVIVSTLLAFPGRPGMAAARVLSGVAVAMAAGAFAAPPPACTEADAHGHTHDERAGVGGPRWLAAAGAELGTTAPALVVGALLAASLKAVVPASVLTAAGTQPLVGAIALMALAFVMSLCSQADAFVAAALPVGTLPRLAFLTLGPMLDLRLAVLYRREFGGRWLARYAVVVVPATLVAVTVCVTAGLA